MANQNIATTKDYVRSFLKYPGGKYRILDKLLPLFPSGQRFVEPFVGSGVVFANVNYSSYFLGDINEDLMAIYELLSFGDDESFREFIINTKTMFDDGNNKKYYYKARKLFNKRGLNIHKYEQFIYLNRHCFNGLCRYNKDGCFNSPFGKFKKIYFPEDELQYFYKKLSQDNVTLQTGSFSLNEFGQGDVIYCDPPYYPLNENSFTSFASNSFGVNEQKRLASEAAEARTRGAAVLISNHDLPATRELYKDATRIVSFPVRRFIAAKAKDRVQVQELVAIY